MLNELAPGVLWMPPVHATDRPVLVAIVGTRATLVVDAGNSAQHARQFLDALAARAVSPVRYLALTHAHWDHVFGASEFDAVAIATEATRTQVSEMATYSWSEAALQARVESGDEIGFCRDMILAELTPAERAELQVRVPDVAFRGALSIDLGDRSVDLREVGGDHAADSCIVVVPGTVAILGDCVYRHLHAEPNYFTRRRLFPLLDRLLALDVQHFVLGHDDAPMSRAAFEAEARMMRTAGALVAEHGRDDAAIRAATVRRRAADNEDTVLEFVELFQAGVAHEGA